MTRCTSAKSIGCSVQIFSCIMNVVSERRMYFSSHGTIGTARSTSRLSHGSLVRPSVHPSVCLVHLVVHTVNFKGVKDFQIPRCLLREHRHHLEEFLEADSFGDRRRVSWILASCKDFRDPFSKWIFLKMKEETNILVERKFKIKVKSLILF